MAKFKTRARAVDMLGRQQIAGIPTAISELFKNAHDAYADRVEVDYFRRKNLFVLRDDGMGMTREEFEKRWLTIGTESKMCSKALPPPPCDPNKPERPMLGEKGIGRLAIASIGPQVLVLSRAKRNEVQDVLIAVFINWGLFEAPGIDLDDIDIPLREFPGGSLPDVRAIADMVEEFRSNVLRFGEMLPEELASRLNNELNLFHVNPVQIDAWLHSPSLKDGYGTHFIITPASELISQDIDRSDKDKASPMTKFLLGFVNTMTPDHPRPVLIPAFRDWHTDECGDDIIAEREFFLPKEFLNADHHFNGEFDEYGQFKGTISIYGENTENYVIPWTGGKGIPTKCGIFKFQMANVMGNFRESTLPEEEWVALKNKMELIGGLYIYRDGIRILPYGDTDFDWLDIEFKRTKHAGYYHFSHRRIFGVVEVTGKNNSGLQEKAGREGFRENDAYRQFKSILKNFLGRVVADFIREEGARSDRYLERRNELSKLRKALDARAESVSGKRNLLVKELECFFARHDAKQPRSEVADIEKRINMELADISNIADSSLAAGKVLDIERKFRSELESLRSAYQITKPRIGLTKRLVKEWEDYQNAWDELDRTIFIPARNFLENTIGIRAKEAKLELDRRLRIEIALNELKEDTSKTVKKERKNTTEAVEKVQSEIKKAASDSIRHVEDILSHVDAEFHRWGNIHEIPDEKLVAKRADLENKIISVRDQEAEFLRYLREQLESINFLHEGTGRLDELEALEQRTVQLEEQSDADLQLSQLGMAIEIINHEFDANIRTIRTNLRRLKAWADVNPDLDNLYKNVRTSFDHLDSYLTLFTPLQRRLQRTETEISGKEIALFLKDLFNERFKRHEINLVVTDAFSKKKIIGYPSSYYPVFVNLIDNAAYWVKDRSFKEITLDADENAFIIWDTGPGIAERDRDDVFEFGFTRKPNGRGMGLYISREALRRIGNELVLSPKSSDCGAMFRIELNKNAEGKDK